MRDRRASAAHWMLRASSIAISVTTLYVASVSQVRAGTVTEYDKTTQQQQSEFVAATLQQIHNYYLSDAETHPKAVCMQKLYLTKNSSGTPRLFTLIQNEIDAARRVGPDKYKVDEVIFGVIEDACRKP